MIGKTSLKNNEPWPVISSFLASSLLLPAPIQAVMSSVRGSRLALHPWYAWKIEKFEMVVLLRAAVSFILPARLLRGRARIFSLRQIELLAVTSGSQRSLGCCCVRLHDHDLLIHYPPWRNDDIMNQWYQSSNSCQTAQCPHRKIATAWLKL